MYVKNLTEDLRLRLTASDMEFLKNLSAERGSTVSECIRSIIGEYRRSIKTLEVLQSAINLAKEDNTKTELEGDAVHGYTKSDIDNIV